MGFVDEEDDRNRRRLHLIDDAFQAVLKLTFDTGTGLQQAEVKGANLHLPEGGRNIARGDAEREAFHDGRLADTRLAGEDGVILAATREDIDHLADLKIASEDGVDFAGFRLRRQVDGVLVEAGSFGDGARGGGLISATRGGRAAGFRQGGGDSIGGGDHVFH